jgi:hypothetical protein
VQPRDLAREHVEGVAGLLDVGDELDAAVGEAEVAGDEEGAAVELGHHVFLGQVLHHLGDLFGVLGVGDGDEAGAAGHAGAGGRAAGVRHGLPVEGVADVLRELADLPAARHVQHDLGVDEGRGCRPRRRPPSRSRRRGPWCRRRASRS